MEKYLIALDLDGTIIPGLYDVNEYTLKVFKKLATEGHKIVIATGRPFRSSFFVYQGMGLDTFMINYNGEYIHNPITKEVLLNDHLVREECLDVVNNMKDNYSHIFFESYDDIYANVDDPYVYPLMHHEEGKSKIFEGNLNEILPVHVHGSLILAKEGCGKKIVDYVNNRFKKLKARMWNWGGYNEIVELYSLTSDKSSSFEMVMKYYGFDREHTIVFGDSMNDCDIFRLVGLSIAPKNACPKIKELADINLDLTCEECGPARYINERFNLGIEYDN